jgi:hypothetical protein
MAIKTAGALFDRRDLRLSANFMPDAVYEPKACIQNHWRRAGWEFVQRDATLLHAIALIALKRALEPPGYSSDVERATSLGE